MSFSSGFNDKKSGCLKTPLSLEDMHNALQDVIEDNRKIREDNRNIREDNRNVREDNRNIREDNRKIHEDNRKIHEDLDRQMAWCQVEHSAIISRANEAEGWMGARVRFLTIIFTSFDNNCILQDPMFLSRLHLRTLLDRGQAELAVFLQLPDRVNTSASGLWRIFLDGEDGRRLDDERLRVARTALTAHGAPDTPAPARIQAVLGNPDANRAPFSHT